MLERSDRPIEEVMKLLAESGVESGLLVPTETGLAKSILDAHGQLREYLRREGLHDYGAQAKGQESKVITPAWHVTPDSMEAARASLYRPETKDGDPRIWFTGLPKHAEAGNLLLILVHAGAIYVANASTPGLLDSIGDPGTPLGGVVGAIASAKNAPAEELVGKLREVSKLGFVRSLRAGPTGVGMTLETLLGIAANSSKAPDFKGIEIKASRTLGPRQRSNRITLFSKVPDWQSSALNSAVSLLNAHGYDKNARRQLYCSLNNVPNSLGLFLSPIDADLHALHGTPDASTKVVQWGIEGLREALAAKHQQTFWVKAAVRRSAGGSEEFHYVQALHTRGPMVSNLESLFERGHIELDFVLHLLNRDAGQRPRARDHGYLFKMDPGNMGLIFPPSVQYDLR